MRQLTSSRHGYALLLSILIMGAILTSALVEFMVIALSSAKDSFVTAKSHQALSNAEACAERALRFLRASPTYTGNETFSLPDGSCTIKAIVVNGNSRSLCTEGLAGKSKRRLEIDVSAVFPTIKIGTWKEVPSFSLCSS